MKVTLYQWKDDDDGSRRDEMHVDGQEKEYCGPLYECPEDAIIGRSLIACSDIVGWMKKVSEAHKAGESVEFETVAGKPS